MLVFEKGVLETILRKRKIVKRFLKIEIENLHIMLVSTYLMVNITFTSF
jgi:hypothetical protein